MESKYPTIFFNEHIIALSDHIIDDPKNNRKLSAVKKGRIYTAQGFEKGCCEEMVNVNIAAYDTFYHACPKCGNEKKYRKGDLFFIPLSLFEPARDNDLQKVLDKMEKQENGRK